MMMSPIDRKPLPRCPQFPLPTKPAPKHDFKKMDTDKNGTINRDEFIKNGNQGPIGWATQRIRSQEFDKLDRNKDGELSKLEQFMAQVSKFPRPTFPQPTLPKPVIDIKEQIFG